MGGRAWAPSSGFDASDQRPLSDHAHLASAVGDGKIADSVLGEQTPRGQRPSPNRSRRSREEQGPPGASASFPSQCQGGPEPSSERRSCSSGVAGFLGGWG